MGRVTRGKDVSMSVCVKGCPLVCALLCLLIVAPQTDGFAVGRGMSDLVILVDTVARNKAHAEALAPCFKVQMLWVFYFAQTGGRAYLISIFAGAARELRDFHGSDVWAHRCHEARLGLESGAWLRCLCELGG